MSNFSTHSNTTNTLQTNTETSKKKAPPIKAPVGQAKGPNLQNVQSKIGSLNNVHHKPAGGEKKIESQKLNWNKNSKIGSLENANHKPKGGNIRVTTQKLDWNVKSKVGSLNNVKHVPGGGNVQIFDEKYISSKASSTRSGNSTPNTIAQYSADDLLKETGQKLTIKD